MVDFLTLAREKLTADRTYYVRTDGSDSNTGLANTAGGAFLTIQKAIDTAAALDCSIYNVTISVGAGTFATAITLKQMLGSGTFSILGAGVTTIINVTTTDAIFGASVGAWTLGSVKVLSSAGSGISISGRSTLTITAPFEIGACLVAGFRVSAKASLRVLAYTISGGGVYHYLVFNHGEVACVSVTVTVSGTPAFSNSFANASKMSLIDLEGVTWSGSATGVRYISATNSVINTVGGTLPGNSAGTATTGQYN